MKCPKCKYVSHDYLDVCRKCGVDLVAFKHDMGLLVLQPGVLDLSLVLVEAGADDLFASVEEEVTMHTGNDDAFDMSLDDPDQPGVRRAPVGAPWAGVQETAEDSTGLEHLTHELDVSARSAALVASQPAAPAPHDTPPPPPTAAVPPPALPEEGMLGHVTLEMEFASMSAELPPAVPAEPTSMLPPHVPETAAIPAERVEMAESSGEAHFEGIDDGASVAAASGAMTSLPLPDIVLAEYTPAVPEEQGLEIVDVPSPEEVSLWPVLELAQDTAASAAETTLPGHLTLELDASEIMAPWPSMTLDDVRLDDLPGDMQSPISPPQNQAGDEEALLLDLDDVEGDDDAQA
jgi:hypothetical protein